MVLLITTVSFFSGSIFAGCQRNRNLEVLQYVYAKDVGSQIA
jgi:hypothetical protein